MTPKSKMIAFAMAGTVAAASAVVMRGPERMPHAHDLPVKVHMAELVIGATHGLTEIGWENPAIEARVAVLEEASEPHRDDALRETGRQQALSGSWGDDILEAYLDVLNTPAEAIFAPSDPGALRAEYEGLRKTQSAWGAASTMLEAHKTSYEVTAVTGRIQDVARVWDKVKARVGADATDAEVVARAMEGLGYAQGPIKYQEPTAWMQEDLGRFKLLGHMSPRAGYGDLPETFRRREPIEMDVISSPGEPV